MGKGWIIGFTAVSTILCGAAAVFYLGYWPKVMKHNSALIALVVEEGLAEYRQEHAALPEGREPEVIAALLGQNPKQKSYLRPDFRQFLDEHGEILDSWKQPFRFDRASDGGIKLRSAGPNGLFDDEDDVTSSDDFN